MRRETIQSLQVFCLALFIVSGVFAINYWGRGQGDILRFFRIGDVLPLSPRLQPQPNSLYAGELGYDGQLFLTLALDPALRENGTLEALDNPRYRYRRILFPVLGYLFAAGQSNAVPYAMVYLNLLFFAGMAGTAGAIFGTFQKSPLWGLGVLAVPGYWCSFLLTTSDLLAGLLLLLTLAAWLRNRFGLAALLYSLMILTHETMLLAGGGLMLCLLSRRNLRGTLLMSAGILPAVLWNLHVLRRIPAGEGTSGLTENFAWPGQGILEKMQSILTGAPDIKWLFDSGVFLFLGLTFLFVLFKSGPPQKSPFWGVALAYFCFFLISKMQILGYYLDFLRVFGGAVLMGVLAGCVTTMPRVHRLLLAFWTSASVAMVVLYSAGGI